jgi:tetratricopeptide (TPR) repeat protein
MRMDEQRQRRSTRTQDRAIRVYVSSTLCDMHAEREELAKVVFPDLREICESRGVTFTEVDLRSGLGADPKAEAKILPSALAEIQGSRPFFIAMLGDRYGCVPATIPPHLFAAHPWLAKRRQCSITELEILHGALENAAAAEHAFFYFRDPAYAASLPPDQAAACVETGELPARLADLKDRIRKSHTEGNLKHAPRETYPDPKGLGVLVKRDLHSVIDRLFPEGSQPDDLSRDRAEHAAFARSRAHVYVERPDDLARLDAHFAGGGPPLLILGDPGVGKSALVANWARRLRARTAIDPKAKRSLWTRIAGQRERASPQPPPLVLEHYQSATPPSTDWAAVVRRLLGELSRHFHLHLSIPHWPDGLRLAFATALHQAAARGRVALILDGIDQIDSRGRAPDLAWLPPEIPVNVRLVVSARPGPALDDLARRGWPTMSVEPLALGERRMLAASYHLAQSKKELPAERLQKIVSAEPCENPLYLRALLDEVTHWSDDETLDFGLARYLEARTPDALCARILERYESDYEDDRPGLVRDAMTAIWAARRGLAEPELLETLGTEAGPLPQVFWSPLRLLADALLVSRSGLLGFAHESARQAVLERYLADDLDRKAAHEQLANCFETAPLGRRKIDELAWQLAQAGAWLRLYELLGDGKYLRAAWKADRFDVNELWVDLEANSTLKAVDAYAEVVRGVPGTEHVAWHVASLLRAMGYPEEALAVRSKLVEHYRAAGDLSNLAASLGNLGLILQERREMESAMALHREAEQISRQLGNLDQVQLALGNQALILKSRGEVPAAVALFRDQEKICRQIGNYDELQKCLGNQAVAYFDRRELDGALMLYKEKERIARQVGNLDSVQSSLGSQGQVLQQKGEIEPALALFKEQERICKQLGNLHGLQKSLGNQANLLYGRGDLDAALDLNKEQERICRQLGNSDGLAVSLANQALFHKDRGDSAQALALAQEAHTLAKEHCMAGLERQVKAILDEIQGQP